MSGGTSYKEIGIGRGGDARQNARALARLKEIVDRFDVPASGTVADQRTLTSSSTSSEVRAAVITLIRDLQGGG